MLNDNHNGKVVDSLDGFDVVECHKCQFKHIMPLPTNKELTQFYSEEYFHYDKSTYIDEIHEDIEWWELVFNDKYDSFEELLPKNRRSLLDVGCGYGHFLSAGEKRGWEVTGIEPSRTAFNYCKKEFNLNVINKVFDNETKTELGFFDVIHLAFVLEHVRDPYNLLVNVHEKLKPGGLICVEVPNDYNPFQIALKKSRNFNPWWVYPTHHINYFDFGSLGSLLDQVGFKVVLKDATFPIDIFLLMGYNYVNKNEIGRKCHMSRKNFELNLFKANMNSLKRKIYKSFSELGVGRELIMVASKREVS